MSEVRIERKCDICGEDMKEFVRAGISFQNHNTGLTEMFTVKSQGNSGFDCCPKCNKKIFEALNTVVPMKRLSFDFRTSAWSL